MYNVLLVSQIGEYYLKEKFPENEIVIDINSKDKTIFNYLGMTINEWYQKEIESVNGKKKEKIANSNIAVLNINLETGEIDVDIKGLPVEKSINPYLKLFDGRWNVEYSMIQPPNGVKNRLVKIYLIPYLEAKVGKDICENIIKDILEKADNLNTTFITFKINNKWLYEIDEIVDICYNSTLGPLNQPCICPICGREHRISFTKSKFFKGKQIITDIYKEKGFKKEEEHFLNFCPECYMKLSEGYTRIFSSGNENEIFTVTKQGIYKLMFVPKTILSNEELQYLITIFGNIYKKQKTSDIEKMNEFAFKFRRLKSLKGQFVLFKNKNNMERIVMALDIPIQSVFYKMENIQLPNLTKCLQKKIILSFDGYILLNLIQRFLDDEQKIDRYVFQIIESIAHGNVEKNLLINWINNSYNKEFKNNEVKYPKEFIKKIMFNEYMKEMMIMKEKYSYDDTQKSMLSKMKTKNETNDELIQYIIERGIHPNTAYLIFLGATMKHIETMQYKKKITPNMFGRIKGIYSLEHLNMLHQKVIDKVADYTSGEITSANITLALAETFYSFEPMTQLPEDAVHSLTFGYGQILINLLTKDKE